MRIRKLTGWLTWVLLILGCIGGIGVLTKPFNSSAQQSSPDFTKIEALAEQVVRLYMTVDSEKDTRSVQLAKIAPEASKYVVASENDNKQIVDQVKSRRPYFSGSKAVAVVDAFTLAVKPNKDKQVQVQGKELTAFISRQYEVTVVLEPDNKGNYYATGLPLIRPVELQSAQPASEDTNLSEVKDAMMPVLKASIPGLLSGNMIEIQNFLAKGSAVKPYQGEYEYKALDRVWLRQNGDQYIADVSVKVRDILLDTSFFIRLNMVLVQQEGKYYILSVT